MVDGTGMSPAADKSKNKLCRELMEVMKKMVGHFNKSAGDKILLDIIIEDMSEGRGSKAKLAQAVSQRWVSACKMMLRVLERWDALERFYLEHDKSQFPLKDRQTEVEEVYTIFKAVNDVVVYSQTTFESTALVGGLQKLATLGTVVLEPDRPLEVLHVRQTGQSGQHPKPTPREHLALTKTAVATRGAFLEGLAWRFTRPR